MVLVCGIPLLFMEFAVGQYTRLGPVHAFAKICPLLKGKRLSRMVNLCWYDGEQISAGFSFIFVDLFIFVVGPPLKHNLFLYAFIIDLKIQIQESNSYICWKIFNY